MSREEIEKLQALLEYWTEHNREHSQEVKDWAAKAAGWGDGQLADELSLAAQVMDQASEKLEKTRQGLQEA